MPEMKSPSVTPVASDLERELRRVVEGEVRFDDYSRLLYSTDASMYQVEPIGVVLPRSKGDVQAVLELANRYNVPVLPRGGGESGGALVPPPPRGDRGRAERPRAADGPPLRAGHLDLAPGDGRWNVQE